MKRYPTLLFAAAVSVFASPFIASSADWPHIMGPNNNRKTSESVPATWTAGRPHKVWEIPANGGFSSFVTGAGRAYTVLPIRDRETVLAVDR